MTYHDISWQIMTYHEISWHIMTFSHKNKEHYFLSRKHATFLLRKFIIARLSTAFEDLLGSSMAPQVMPHCLRQSMNYNYYLVDILHICDHTNPSQQDLTPHDGRDQLYATPWHPAGGQHQLSLLISCFVVSEFPTANPKSMHCLKQLTWKNQQWMSSLRCRRWLTLEIRGQRYQHRPVLIDIY